jgi:hypothetical protein
MKKKCKIISWIVWILMLCLWILTYYIFVIDKENIEIDKYNFEQLEIVDNTIMNDEKYNKWFRDIWAFNKIYKTNIKPIKNCYYISHRNWDEKYLFGFKLESLLYKIRYMSGYIAYPKYDLPERVVRMWLRWHNVKESWDLNYSDFIEHISNPCDEDYL